MTQVPAGWTSARLVDLIGSDGLMNDGDWVESKDQDPEGDIRLIQLADVGDGVFRDRSSRFLTREMAQQLGCTLLQPGDLLVSRMAEPIGRTCTFPGFSYDCATVVDVCIIRIGRHGPDRTWLQHTLNSAPMRDVIEKLASGTTRKRISRSNLATVIVPLPPLNEQRRIVAKIDALMARSRRAKESLDAIPPLLERLRQSILAAAFRGDLTADWRAQNPDVEPAEKLLERIETPPRPPRYASRSVAVLPGDAALSVGNPDTPTAPGWRWVPLVDVARLESGHTPSRRQPEWWGGDVPWISLKDAGWHHGRTIFETRETTNELGLANSAARVLPEGTVCLSRTGTIGYSTVMGRPMATSQDFANWVCTEAVNPHWLKHLFAAERHALHQFSAQTTNIATIYYPELISFHVCLPPIAEQNEIVRRVEKAMSQLDAARKAHAGGAKRIAELDRAILAKAFRGELVPQDPNDEPAEQMLARLGSTETPTKGKRGRPRQKGA